MTISAPITVFMRASQNDDMFENCKFPDKCVLCFFRNASRKFKRNKKLGFAQNSTSLAGGNLVDSSPLASHTEAFWGPHGGIRPGSML